MREEKHGGAMPLAPISRIERKKKNNQNISQAQLLLS
jgi:hypothetical protein